MHQPLPKPEPISNCSGPSLVTYWRKDKREWAAAVKEKSERSNPADTKANKEGEGVRERLGGQLVDSSFMDLLPRVENSPDTISETPKKGTKKEKHGQRKND